MKRLVLVLLLVGCHRRDLPPLSSALLSMGAPSSVAQDAAIGVLGDAATRVEARLRGGAAPAEALNAVVFDELHFEREVKEADPRFMRLAQVLADRKGSCLGLAAVYLALGERLGPAHHFAVEGILVPGHLFVRVGGRNVELLRRGEQMPDQWYREKYEIPEKDAPAYLRPLAPAELLGLYDYNIGNDLRLQGRFVEAGPASTRGRRSVRVDRDDFQVGARKQRRRDRQQPIVRAHQRMLAPGRQSGAETLLEERDAVGQGCGGKDNMVELEPGRRRCVHVHGPCYRLTSCPAQTETSPHYPQGVAILP